MGGGALEGREGWVAWWLRQPAMDSERGWMPCAGGALYILDQVWVGARRACRRFAASCPSVRPNRFQKTTHPPERSQRSSSVWNLRSSLPSMRKHSHSLGGDQRWMIAIGHETHLRSRQMSAASQRMKRRSFSAIDQYIGTLVTESDFPLNSVCDCEFSFR